MNFFYSFFTLAFFFPLLGIAQSSTIKGRVIDQDDKGSIPFVSIGIKNSSYGTVADSAGNFILLSDSGVKTQTDSVVFTAVGYQRLSLPLGGLLSSDNQITLSPATNLLSAVNIKINSPTLKSYGRSDSRVILSPRARTFWSDGYFVCSLGDTSPETNRIYILNQG